MKKCTLYFVVLLSVFSFAQEKPTYKIGVLLDKVTPELSPLIEKLQVEIKAVVGEDANILFPGESLLANDFNLENARRNYQQLLGDDIDIILAFGVVNNAIISPIKVHNKPTILFGALNKDLHELDLNRTTSGIKNFTFFIESESFQEDLDKFKELSNFKNLGIAVDAPVANILPLKETFDREVASLDASYRLIPFQTADDIIANLDGVDAIYMAGGFFLSRAENDKLAKAFIQAKLPSFYGERPRRCKKRLFCHLAGR